MKTFFLCVLALFVTGFIQGQPNIILIQSDDQSNLAVGSYGYGTIQTPHIDEIASRGTYFTKAYNMGCWSPAVCIPSRTMLFYGVHLWEAARINTDHVPGPSLTERLSEAGYTTYFTGKWHARGKGPRETFDHVGQVLPGQLKTFYTEDGHITDIVAEEAVEFIREAAGHEDPFFLYVAFNAPHVPRQTEQKYYDLYPPEEIALPPSVKDGPLHPHIKYNYSPDPLRSASMRVRYQQNNAMVTHMDERIGDIVKELKANGYYENSILVFMSDQGINFGENGVAGKVCLYDVSVTTPLIISGPGLPKGRKFHERIYLQDLYPTLLELAGTSIPEYMDFKTLVPILKGEQTESPYSSIYMGMFDDQRGIISQDYKLIMYPLAGAAELYYLKEDPWEMNNLLNQKSSTQILETLAKEFLNWQDITGDTLSVNEIYPGIF
jgi:arylsulfatase A-like enzyme